MAEIMDAGQMQPQEQYVKRLCVAKCEHGSMDYQYLNLPKDHGVYYQDYDHPLMNANDHKGKEHVMQFGRCKSPTNPKNQANDILSKAVPILGVIDLVKSDLLKCDGCKCSPKTLRSWEEVNGANRLDGAPAVVNSSQLVCVYGGMITITEEDTGDADQSKDQNEEQPPEEKDMLDTLPANMADKIRDMNSEADAEAAAMAEAAAEWYAQNADTFALDFGCSPLMSAANYSSNSTRMIAPECMNDAGYISEYSGLSNFNMAGTNAGAIGAGAAVAFNAFKALGSPMGMADIIYGMEQQQTAVGYMDGGAAAASMCGLGGLFCSMGLCTTVSFPTSLNMESLMLAEGEVAVLGCSACGTAAPVLMEEKLQIKPVLSSSALARKYSSKRPVAGISGMAVGRARQAAGKSAKLREESLCTITRGKDGLICAEMPNRPMHEILQEKSQGNMMLMRVSNNRYI